MPMRRPRRTSQLDEAYRPLVDAAVCFLFHVRDVTFARVFRLEGIDFEADKDRLMRFSTSLKPTSEQLVAACDVGLNILISEVPPPVEVENRMLESLVRKLEALGHTIAREFKRRSLAAEQAGKELVIASERKQAFCKPAAGDDDLCIVCMDELRSKVYRPCGHRVCCDACACEFYKKSHTCPWCARVVEEP